MAIISLSSNKPEIKIPLCSYIHVYIAFQVYIDYDAQVHVEFLCFHCGEEPFRKTYRDDVEFSPNTLTNSTPTPNRDNKDTDETGNYLIITPFCPEIVLQQNKKKVK